MNKIHSNFDFLQTYEDYFYEKIKRGQLPLSTIIQYGTNLIKTS